MNDEWLHARECPGAEPTGRPQTVAAAPDQLLTGLPVGLPTLTVYCVECKEKLTAGQTIVVYGYRAAERERWDLTRCYCEACSPSGIRTPTLGTTELLARAQLGTTSFPQSQTPQLCLTDVVLLAYSPPREGGCP